MSSTPQSQSSADAFSLRIVTLDYYMSPPIPNLDFLYSSFQGRTVEKVPVIRIYGSTPAGQKACLHVHQALPYLYIPCPDNAIKNPEEGDKFIHVLSNTLEKVLKHKGSSTTKRQHVHECCLVRAKKLYGYHATDDLFIKIYLYYPHDIGRAATMLLDGAVLNTSFQPHESHIPYLLQFLVDYNLYGMSHIHLSKFKFRPPVPNECIRRVACLQRHGVDTVQAHQSAVWLSSTIPSGSIWPDSFIGNGLEDESNHIIWRQSTCALEVDASVNDILNEKYKMYTSLSQTRSEVKMVQSLVPIWEEEYEHLGTPDSVRPPDSSKPTPESVLGRFNHGLEFQKALSELYVGIDETIPSNFSATEGDLNLENCPDSCIPSSEPLKHLSEGDKIVMPSCRSLFQENKRAALFEKTFDQLKSPDKSLPELCRNAAQESLDTEALGLLSWLASTQAADDFTFDDELVHEALLSPLLSAKSYKEALEIAHSDYEIASQQECQDILDSLQGLHGIEGPKEEASCSTDQELTIHVSSGSLIPQVDGSFDDDFSTPKKDKLSEANTSSGKDKYSVHQMGRCSSTRLGSKHKRSELLWGPLPFAFKQKEKENSELVICHDEEIKSDSEFSVSSDSNDRYCEAGLVTCDEKEGNLGHSSSIRDLMRRKRCVRTEQLDTVMQNAKMMDLCTEEPMHHKSEGKICNSIPQEGPSIKSCNMGQDVAVQENAICTTSCTCHACTGTLHIDYYSHLNQKSVSLFSNQLMQSEIPADEHHHSQKESTEGACVEATSEAEGFKVTGISLQQIQSIKFSEADQTRNSGTTTCSTISGGHKTSMSDTSWCTMNACNIKLADSSKRFKSLLVENSNVEVLEFHNFERQPVVEPFKEEVDTCTRNLTTVHVEQSLMHNLREHGSNQDGKTTQKRFLQTHFKREGESDSVLDKDIQNGENDFNAGWTNNMLNPDFETSIALNKIKDTSAYAEMAWSSKPPSRDEVGKYPQDSSGTAVHAEMAGINSDRQHLDVLPFFSWKFEYENSSKWLNIEDLTSHHESALGVPAHFQNDGSVLYLLTHAFLPPTQESVQQWLLEKVERNHLNVSEGDDREEISAKSHVTHSMKPDRLSQGSIGVTEVENHDSQVNDVSNEQHKGGLQFREKAVNIGSRDLSQISGPSLEEKSALTPLSQMGFRDSANIGGGQQLTLISMEVQAESRGDLLPDPKIDAINVLSLAIQEDSNQTVDVYVLMRCNDEKLYERNVDGVSDCNISIFNDEKHLLDHFVKMVSLFDPDVLMGWEIQGGSLGFLAERAAQLGISLLKKISRIRACETICKTSDFAEPELDNVQNPVLVSDSVSEYSIIEDEWGRTHASGIHVSGRIVLNIWRLMRAELKLNMYSVEAVAEEVLRRKIPSISNRVLNCWFLSGPSHARYRCIEYVTKRAKLNLEIMNQLDMINRTSELARVFGIDFFSVLSRGSQFRVESMLLRLAHTQNYLAISPGSQQVASQPAMECLPLVMEPQSGFYTDPVVVLDFQSLYPSMIIAYNLCYSTCLGTVFSSKASVLGVTSYFPDLLLLKDLKQQILLTPNGIMYVPPKVRKGVLPRLLEEILSTRIMVKQAMKRLMPSQQVLQRIFNARQLALKLIANVTYGYTAAGFSGRMPCAELADSIVQCGRRTLETSISFVNQNDKWNAQVIYGDTDSMFVLLKGRSREEAFRIGNEIAAAITSMNPDPVTLKMEKVYHPCFLLTKKRYVGYSYESPDQEKPVFDAKGIETVRRDTCPAVAKTLERSIRLIFERQDISVVKNYLQRQWRRILSGKISLQDFVFAKEVRLGTYSARASSLPPAAIVAIKAMQIDPRAEPQYGERIPYVVIHGEPGARLVDMVVNPYILLDINSPYRLNELYYINKQIIPALQRVFGLVGADLKHWFSELPRLVRPTLAKRHYVSHSESLNEFDYDTMSETSKMVQAKRSRIDTYYISKHCILCGYLAQASSYLCSKCSKKEPVVAIAVIGKASRLEREIQHLAAICRHCGGGDWLIESGVKCTSLACSIFYERRKVQKELQATSSFATAAGFYPMCMAELF